MNSFWIFASLNLAPIAFVIATSPLKGLGRLVAPDTLVVAMLYAIFAIRPLFTDRFRTATRNDLGFYGLVPTLDGQVTASIVGTVLMWSIALGAAWYSHRGERTDSTQRCSTATERVPGDPSQLRTGRAVVITVAALGTYSALLIQLMGPRRFLAMFSGRSAEVSVVGVPEILTTLPLAGSIAAATLLLTARATPLKANEWYAVGFCSLASIFAVSQLGNRRLIIPAVLIVATAMLMRRPVPIKIWHFPAALVALIALATIPFIRSSGSRMQGENFLSALIRSVNESGPLAPIENFFTSYDTEMYDYIAILASDIENGRLQYGLGSGTFLDFLARPFPANMTPFDGRSDELTAHVFNFSCFGGRCDVPNPVQSIGGILYFDWGFIGVLIGGIIVGIIVRALADRWSRSAALTTSQCLITAVCASHAMIVVRTDSMAALWWCIYAVLVGLVVLAAMGQWGATAKPTKRPSTRRKPAGQKLLQSQQRL